ncbi:hypothetical protein LC653_32450 [Nostoc sp. CHAB 5784]|uniref:hypothetical protein n=1 Tax=Nostoc mirabile TaxID=2907820 RepID=UPI001E64FC8A|nr:hypothetical protein [Nostoc mirabile]MCC5668436.1 hypothetical protein [Nostoc mirabile CHAB5784]
MGILPKLANYCQQQPPQTRSSLCQFFGINTATSSCIQVKEQTIDIHLTLYQSYQQPTAIF